MSAVAISKYLIAVFFSSPYWFYQKLEFMSKCMVWTQLNFHSETFKSGWKMQGVGFISKQQFILHFTCVVEFLGLYWIIDWTIKLSVAVVNYVKNWFNF